MLGVTFVLANTTPGSYANNAGNVSHVNVCVYLTGPADNAQCSPLQEEVVLNTDRIALYLANSACPNKWKTEYFGGKNIFQSMILVFQNYNFCFGPLTTTLVLYLGRPAENCAKYLDLSAYRAV